MSASQTLINSPQTLNFQLVLLKQIQSRLNRKSTIYHVKCAYGLKQFQRTSWVKATHCDLIHFPSKGRNRLKFQCCSRKGNKLMVIETSKHFATKSEKFFFYFGTEAVNIRMNNLKKTGSFSGLQRSIIKFIHENILSSLSLCFCGFYSLVLVTPDGEA